MQPSLNFLSYYWDQLHQNNSGQPKRFCNPHLRRKTTNSAKNWVAKSWFANAIACVLDNTFILHPLQPVSKQNIFFFRFIKPWHVKEQQRTTTYRKSPLNFNPSSTTWREGTGTESTGWEEGFCGFNPYDRYGSHEPWLSHHETSGKRNLVRTR